MLQIFRDLVLKLTGKSTVPQASEEEGEDCCNGVVHIAYRGLSDDRQYIAYSRKWDEIRFFKPNGLKVFCADCRRRLL